MFREITLNDDLFREVERGVRWAAADLPAGRVEGGRLIHSGGTIRLLQDSLLKGTDGFLVAAERFGISICAGSAVGFLSAIINVAWHISHGVGPGHDRIPRFKSRFYKHEANLIGPEHPHAHIADLDEGFWVSYCKALVERQFNGLIFNSVSHPFSYFLDYDRFPEAADGSKRRRAETLAGLRCAFGVARSFGLKTFLQHYVGVVPREFARKHGLCILRGDREKLPAHIQHPMVDEYSRYAYRRTLELLPEMTGLYINFWTSPNSSDFLRRCLYPEVAAAARVPELILRANEFNSVPDMVSLVRAYPGKVRLAHRIMDHSDVYYYPRADRRITEWKNALPEIELMVIAGPCHSSARAQSKRLWADPEFVRAALADAEKKGADSVAFHTSYDLLCGDVDAARLAGPREIHMASLNRGHMEAVVDYVRGQAFVREGYESRLARRLKLTRSKASTVFSAILSASQISLLTFQQFLMASEYEGWLLPKRANFYADPFFLPPMTVVDDMAGLPMELYPAWLNTNIRSRFVPHDVQPVIDYVDSSKPRVKRNPMVIAAALKEHAETAMMLARRAAGSKPTPVMHTLLVTTREMYNWGMRVHHEIRAAVGIYKAFFSASRGQTLRGLRSALEELRAALPRIRTGDPYGARTLPLLEETSTERDIALIQRLIHNLERDDYPYSAFAAFAASIREHNEIRRTVRPWREIRPRETRLIETRLAAAIAHARTAMKKLPAPSQARYRRNVRRWLDYVAREYEGVTPPVYAVADDSSAGDDFLRVIHDQCFRYGENCLVDLMAFFTPTDFLRDEDVAFRLTTAEDGLVVSVRENGVDVDALEKRWDRFERSDSDEHFIKLWVDRSGEGKRMEVYHIFSRGVSALKDSLTVHGRQYTEVGWRVAIDGKVRYRRGRDWWRLDYTIPWRDLGGRPVSGEKWKANLATSTPISRNRQNAWCPGYEMVQGKFARMGTLIFK